MKKFIMIIVICFIYTLGFTSDSNKPVFKETNKTSEVYQELKSTKITHHQLRVKNIQERVFMSSSKKYTKHAKEIAEAVVINSDRFNFPPELILALINYESEFNPRAVSPRGARGLMQINTKVHREEIKKAGVTNIYDIHSNIYMGCSILTDKLKDSKDISEALRKYNGASTNQFSKEVLFIYAKYMLSGIG